MERGLDEQPWDYDGGDPDGQPWDTAEGDSAGAPSAGGEGGDSPSGRRLFQRLAEHIHGLLRWGRGRKAAEVEIIGPPRTSMDVLNYFDLPDKDTIIRLLYEAGWREDAGPHGRESFRFFGPRLLRHGDHQDLAFNAAASIYYDVESADRFIFCPVSKKLAAIGEASQPENE